MVLVVSGGVGHEDAVKVGEKVFGGLKVGKGREIIKPTFVGSDLR
jgi:predicted Zn-dependent peptidase